MATPSPTPFATTVYEEAHGVEMFRMLARYGPKDFPASNPEDMAYWEGVGFTAGLPFAFFFLSLIVYFWFLCCRNGCCSCFCGLCPCIRDFCCGPCAPCTCPAITEEDVNAREHDFPVNGCCCLCRKNVRTAIHGGCPTNRPLYARLMLIVIFAALGFVSLRVDQGLKQIQGAIVDVSDVVSGIGDVATNIVDHASDMSDYASNIAANSDLLAAGCGTNASVAIAGTLSDAAGMMSDALESLDGQLDGKTDSIYDIADVIEGASSDEYFMWARTAMLIGVIFSAVGFLGALCIEFKNVFCRFSTHLLMLANCLGVFLLLILTIMVTVELSLGVPMADFCAEGPRPTMITIADNYLSDSAMDLVTYYVECAGEDPLADSFDSAVAQADNITDMLNDYENLLTADTMCCDSTMDEDTANADVVEASCTFFTSSNDGCTASDFCTTNPGNATGVVGVCISGASCPPVAYNRVQQGITNITDADGPIEGIKDEISCASVYGKFDLLLDEALCTKTVNGLYGLFETHAAVVAFTWLAMIIASFLRQSILRAEHCLRNTHHREPEFAVNAVRVDKKASGAELQLSEI